MILLQNEEKLAFKGLISAILLLICSIYYLHITNDNPSLGVADKDFVFLTTSLFGISFLIALQYFFKKYCNEKQQGKISDIFGYTAIILLFGGLSFFGIFWVGMPPTWLSDILIQAISITSVGCITLMHRKGDHKLPASMIFPLMAAIIYLCYRF
jgi:uncharacterized membrane protein SirB2